jgi:hypothetical protein
MLSFMAQFGAGLHPGRDDLIEPLVALFIAVGAGGLVLLVLGQLVPRVRHAVHSRNVRRRRLHDAANAELRARAMMDELCPHGWRAQITLPGASEQPPDDRGDRRCDTVVLDWTAFEDETCRVSVVRRVSAPTISEALEAMVADRRTDETLQHIEQSALGDGVRWPDV